MGLIRLILLLAALLAGCAGKTPERPAALTAPPGSFLAADGTLLSDAEIVRLARNHNFILMGESHANPCDHAVQARLAEALGQAGMRLTIGLEMLPVTVQPALDSFNAGQTDATRLEHEAQWEKHWGHSYSQYKPVLEAARRFDLPLAALNIPRDVMLRFRDKKALTPEEQAMLPRRIIPPGPAQEKALTEQVAMHQSMWAMRNAESGPTQAAAKDERARKFFLVQSLWDSMMAERAFDLRKKTGLPVLILAGGGHVEHGWGIEHRLRVLEPGVRCLRIMPARDADDLIPASGTEPGTAIFFACTARHKSRLGMNIVFAEKQVRIESVEPGSIAERAGLMPGDILLRAGKKPLNDASDLHFAAMAAARQKTPLTLTVRRSETLMDVHLPLPATDR